MDFILKIEYKTLDYSLLAMQIAEYDIIYLASRFHIKGHTREDIAQELRLKIWQALPYYDPNVCGMRTWARKVLKNHLKNLKRDIERHKRKILLHQVPLNELICEESDE